MAPVFKQITIIGVGLIGGSIARAALEKGAAGEVVLFDGNADALKRAGEIGFGRPAASIEDAVRDADAVFHCVPWAPSVRRPRPASGR
jgi:cyclohexadieny/prephenate dehydrogenase